MKTVSEIAAELAAPFPPEIVTWRVGPMTADKKRGQALAYIDARDVMNRLNTVCGVTNWQNRYVPMTDGTACCEIGIRLDGEWIWKSNGADMIADNDRADSKEMAAKGKYSDAFKRAAVLWGIGQYLYDLDCPWVELDEKKRIVASEMQKLRALLSRTAGNASSVAPAPEQKSAYAARKDGDYPRFEKALRDADTLTALMAAWKGMYPTIKTWPQGWRDQIENEKNRCKDKLMIQMDTAAE